MITWPLTIHTDLLDHGWLGQLGACTPECTSAMHKCTPLQIRSGKMPSPFYRLFWHVLNKAQPPLEAEHTFIGRELLAGIVDGSKLWQDEIKEQFCKFTLRYLGSTTGIVVGKVEKSENVSNCIRDIQM